MPAALASELERLAADTLGAAARDIQGVGLEIAAGGARGEARGKEALAVLAHDDEIDGARAGSGGVFERRVGLVVEADGADAVVEIELLAEIDLGRHLDAARPGHLGQAHGAE